MSFEIILVHGVLSIFLFLLINFLGKQSFNIGYMQMSLIAKSAEAPAFNFILRVLTPLFYIIIVSTVLYKLNLDEYVLNIYLVCVYYLFFRALFNLLTGRALLINWTEQIMYFIIIAVLSFLTYDTLIKTKKNILPDFSNISNELWIVVSLFLYTLLSKLLPPEGGSFDIRLQAD